MPELSHNPDDLLYVGYGLIIGESQLTANLQNRWLLSDLKSMNAKIACGKQCVVDISPLSGERLKTIFGSGTDGETGCQCPILWQFSPVKTGRNRRGLVDFGMNQRIVAVD